MVSTAYGALTVAAAVDADLLGPPGTERHLVVSVNAAIPEVARPLADVPGFDSLRRWAHEHSWNDLVAPHHPATWSPRRSDGPVWQRSLRQAWGLGDEPVELVVESLHARPTRALVEIFADSPVTVYSDGLMSYGPTRDALPPEVTDRVGRLLYVDLLEGVAPVLLHEHGVPSVPVPTARVRRLLDDVAAAAPAPRRTGGRTAVVVGQYLSDLDLVPAGQEQALTARMVEVARATGAERVVVVPHPSASGTTGLPGAPGVEVVEDGRPVEALCLALGASTVVSCFSTALFTARSVLGLQSVSVGTPTVLRLLARAENSNRVPAVLADALLPHAALTGPVDVRPPRLATDDPAAVSRLLRAVAFSMQPQRLAGLRAEALPVLRGEDAVPVDDYLPASRRSYLLRVPEPLARRQRRAAVLASVVAGRAGAALAALRGGSRPRR
jgi:hypothetical protein